MEFINKLNLSIAEFKKIRWYNQEIKINNQVKKNNPSITEEDFFNLLLKNVFNVCDLFINQKASILLKSELTAEEIKNIIGEQRWNNFRSAVYSEIAFRIGNEWLPEFANSPRLLTNSWTFANDLREFSVTSDLLNNEARAYLSTPSWSYLETKDGLYMEVVNFLNNATDKASQKVYNQIINKNIELKDELLKEVDKKQENQRNQISFILQQSQNTLLDLPQRSSYTQEFFQSFNNFLNQKTLQIPDGFKIKLHDTDLNEYTYVGRGEIEVYKTDENFVINFKDLKNKIDKFEQTNNKIESLVKDIQKIKETPADNSKITQTIGQLEEDIQNLKITSVDKNEITRKISELEEKIQNTNTTSVDNSEITQKISELEASIQELKSSSHSDSTNHSDLWPAFNDLRKQVGTMVLESEKQTSKISNLEQQFIKLTGSSGISAEEIKKAAEAGSALYTLNAAVQRNAQLIKTIQQDIMKLRKKKEK
ncbi:hypothetical protein [[Mycoplasma] gypis]|uniref:hypothetical protein n=1 Tax=[Mycoplasma] gypis TaxID=92404 RepID=UPI001966F3B9|nr:hypothetical protein [[Mycoplasma] gypis]MBN0919684.1 hypothetical protein [[Mycoplasma] gypis]